MRVPGAPPTSSQCLGPRLAQYSPETQYHTQVVQNVLFEDGSFKKADITALHASGHHLALDVMVTGNPDPSQAASAHLSAQERGKAARYGTRPNGPPWRSHVHSAPSS